ncbi:MAG: 2-oxoacid:acceptor oxidoreductase family protein [Syntrophales bacterium]|nr:2-oxoacid:acceptor oxidoreductase family protein [Syntrophales bacterium]
MYEIIWHGRGGQGVVIAAQLLAEAAYLDNFQGVTATPTFGPERRGAPVAASNRIAAEPIRTFSQIEQADFTIVIDETLFSVVDILSRQKKGGIIVINTAAAAEAVPVSDEYRVAVVDAASIALKNHLIREGAPVVNTPMLGAFAKASGLISLASIERALRSKLSREQVDKNFSAAEAAYVQTSFRRRP